MTTSAKTIGQIKDEVLSYCGDSSSGDLTNQMDQWIIDIHREVEQIHNFSWLIRTANISLKDNVNTYTLPSDFRKMTDPDSVRVGTSSQLTYIDEWKFEENYGLSRFQTASSLQFYRMGGTPVYVQGQPSSPDKLIVISNSTSDTTQTIYIEGTVNGVEGVTESLTLDGTMPVESANTYSYVKRVSKSASSTGIVTVTSNGADVIVKLPYRSRALQYKPITFHPVPNSSLLNTIVSIKYYCSIPDPLDVGDISLIYDPSVLIHGLLYRAYKHQMDQREQQEYQLYDMAVSRLISEDNVNNSATQFVKPIYNFPHNLSV